MRTTKRSTGTAAVGGLLLVTCLMFVLSAIAQEKDKAKTAEDASAAKGKVDAAKAKSDGAKPDKAKSDKAEPDKAKSDTAVPDKSKTDKSETDKTKPDKAKADTTKPDKIEPKPKPKTEAFEKTKKAFDDLIAKIKGIQTEYKLARKEERKPLEKQFDERVAEAKKLREKLEAEARAAVVEDPMNIQLIDVLGGLSHQAWEKGADYERAFQLARLVLENELSARDEPYRKELLAIAAETGFVLGKFTPEPATPKDPKTKQPKTDEDDKRRFQYADTYLTLVKEYPDQDRATLKQYRASLSDARKHWFAEQEIRKAEARLAGDPKKALPRVALETDKGTITLELFEDHAPNTVANFITLVESGFYDGKPFYEFDSNRVFVGRVKDPDDAPKYKIPCETDREDSRRRFRGSVSMELPFGEPNTASHLFRISLKPKPDSDAKSAPSGGNDRSGNSTVFGRVVDGLEVLFELKDRGEFDTNALADTIKKATVLNKRREKYPFKTMADVEKEKKEAEAKAAKEKAAKDKAAKEKAEKAKKALTPDGKDKAPDGKDKAPDGKAKGGAAKPTEKPETNKPPVEAKKP